MDENTPLLGESSRAVQRDGQDEAFHTEPSQSKPHPAAGPEASGSSSTIADIDERLRRWQSVITERFRKGKGKQTDGVSPIEPVALISVFQKVHVSGAGYTNTSTANQHPNTLGASTSSLHVISNEQDIDAEVEEVRRAIDMGIFPQMIQTGSSGSYFARKVDADGKQETVAVFKPRDEEPYGDLNPKRVFLRRYFWWMMGRPCLVPNFSASSEAGASYLDSRLDLHVVPPTHLVDLSSPSFFYPHADREAWRKHKKRPPAKIGSFQLFLRGYVNASEFLRKHPWPSRPPHLLEADLAAEQAAHKLSRKKKRAYMRRCFVAIKRCLLCRTAPLPFDGFEEDRARVGDLEQQQSLPAQLPTSIEEGGFRWTPSTMRAFRVELEKLVVLDFLMRNTDRGLDNFMVRHKEKKDPANANGDMLRDVDFSIKLGAIDNSLSFPHRHPNGIRDYPFGWLWLPADLIGQPFSAETRSHFLPLLSDPTWWIETVAGLKRVFEQDENFSAKIFERQMAVMRGQGLNLVESLLDAGEGPIELCARPRKLVYEEVVRMTKEELAKAAQSAIATLTLHDGAFVPGRPPFNHDHSSDTRDLHTVAERDASDAEDAEPDSNGQPSTSITVEGASQRTNAEADAVSEDPAAHLSPEAQPRSLPETDSAASFTAFAKWQSTQGEALEGDMADLALAQSMTGIEVLERELAASVHHDFGFLKRSRRSAGGSENDGNLRSTTVPPPLVRSPGSSPDEGRENSFGHAADREQGRRGDAASPAEGDPGAEELAGSGGRLSSSRTRSRTMITGGFSRQITLRGRNSHQQQHSGETPYKSPSNFPRLTRSNSEHAGVLMSTASSGAGTRNLDLRPSLRKRMGSVGGWSITSLGSASGTVETAEGTESRQVKVIIQRAVHDPSRAFLRWY